MFQQREICSRIMSTSLALSWLPSGARGCEDALPEATRAVCGGASGDGARVLRRQVLQQRVELAGIVFLGLGLRLGARRLLRPLGRRLWRGGFDRRFWRRRRRCRLGFGQWRRRRQFRRFGCSAGGAAGIGGAGFGSGGAGAGGSGGASAAEGGGAGLGGVGSGTGLGAGGPGNGGSGVASRTGMFGLGCVARVSGPIVTSWTAIGISSGVGG